MSDVIVPDEETKSATVVYPTRNAEKRLPRSRKL